MSTRILSTGSYLPKARLTNADLEKRVDTSDAWIRSRSGISERHVLAPEEATSDLATRAAADALESARLAPDDVDLIVVATCTPDHMFPSTAALVQRNLSPNEPIPAFDINAACAGFVYGLELTSKLLQPNGYQRILLIGADALTPVTNYQDRGTCVLFGDGAGAVVLEFESQPTQDESGHGLVASALCADGTYHELICVPAGGTRRPVDAEAIAERANFVQMNGPQTFKLAVQSMEQVARDCLASASWKLTDVDHVFVHQANARIIDAVADRLELPPERVHRNIEHTGNTSAASIPILLDEMNRADRLQRGDRILFLAFGSGLTWGAAALVW